MANEPYPMYVAQILDKTTLVIAGPAVKDLKPKMRIEVVAMGKVIPGVNVPLVLAKASLVVNAVHPGPYAIAVTDTYEVEVSANPWDIVGFSKGGTRKETREYQLDVDEKDLLGNPADGPISVGDPVVIEGKISAFVDYLLTRLP